MSEGSVELSLVARTDSPIAEANTPACSHEVSSTDYRVAGYVAETYSGESRTFDHRLQSGERFDAGRNRLQHLEYERRVDGEQSSCSSGVRAKGNHWNSTISSVRLSGFSVILRARAATSHWSTRIADRLEE